MASAPPLAGGNPAGRTLTIQFDPILKRLSATAVVPREQSIEGWLWTSTDGSALTVVGDEDAAPSGAPCCHQAAHR